jgi:hypothetical protein
MSRLLRCVVVALSAALLLASPGGAHTSVVIGDMTVGFGWRDEPAYAGLPNAVELTAVDADGVQVVDPNSNLSVTVTFGDATVVRPLTFTEPGLYLTPLVPTQAGTYALHIEGTLAGETVDLDEACSDTTFDCVADASEVEFPASGSAAGTGLGTGGATDGGSNGSGVAIAVSIVALGVGLAALVMTVLRRRHGAEPAS